MANLANLNWWGDFFLTGAMAFLGRLLFTSWAGGMKFRAPWALCRKASPVASLCERRCERGAKGESELRRIFSRVVFRHATALGRVSETTLNRIGNGWLAKDLGWLFARSLF
jgi:hypothetical protein